MAAATEDRKTSVKRGSLHYHELAADAVVYTGTLVGADANGYAETADAGSAAVLGLATETLSNLNGANGDLGVNVERVRVYLENDGTNPVLQEHVGQQAVVVDNQTVGAPGGAGANAGRIESVDANGVWIDLADLA